MQEFLPPVIYHRGRSDLKFTTPDKLISDASGVCSVDMNSPFWRGTPRRALPSRPLLKERFLPPPAQDFPRSIAVF